MTQANLSEILFNPSYNPPETSTLMPRTRNKMSAAMHSTLARDTASSWYRVLNDLLWAWRGVDPIEINQVLARASLPRTRRAAIRSGWILWWTIAETGSTSGSIRVCNGNSVRLNSRTRRSVVNTG
ncbi:alpha/beta hydrolase [Serratia symbiotica]|nr:alpha/beta hydrolase [Serratia symbiotica]